MHDIDALGSRLDFDTLSAISPTVELLRQSALGPGGLFAVRKAELEASADSRRLIAENAALSIRLSDAVKAVVAVSKHRMDTTAHGAFAAQREASIVLAAIAVLSLVSAALIVWLYVGRNIVARLTRLSAGMTAIAAGRLDVVVDDGGADEIGAMGRAVEVFRHNAIERNALRVERAEAAQRLERLVEVEESTAQLAQNEAALRVMFDNMHQGVAMFDGHLALVAWNRPFRDLLQLPHSFLQNRPSFGEFFRLLAWRGEFGSGDVEKMVSASLATIDRPDFDERTRPDGTTFEVRRNPISGGGFVSMYTDITERKRAESQIRRAKEEIEAAFRELKATQANLIHAEKMASSGSTHRRHRPRDQEPTQFRQQFRRSFG